MIQFYVVLWKLDPPVQIYGRSYEKNLIDLPHDECYDKVLSCLLLKSLNLFHFLNHYYHSYQRYINRAAINIYENFLKILSRICLNEPVVKKSHTAFTAHVCKSTVYFLFFIRLSFRGKTSDIIIVFVLGIVTRHWGIVTSNAFVD